MNTTHAYLSFAVEIRFEEDQDLPAGDYIERVTQTSFKCHVHPTDKLHEIVVAFDRWSKDEAEEQSEQMGSHPMGKIISVKDTLEIKSARYRGQKLDFEDSRPINAILKSGDTIEVRAHEKIQFRNKCIVC